MTQLSRPYQIALLALSLLVVVWFVALRGHSAATSTGAGSSPAASAPAPTAAGEAKAAAAPSHVYHGPVPGLQGLTHAIAKAHGAVANSQQNAKQVEDESAQASHSNSAGAASSAGSSSPSAHAVASRDAAAKHSAARRSQAARRAAQSRPTTRNPASAHRTHSASPTMQASVEAELKQGKVVAILFWNPKASVDLEVQRELRSVGHALGAKIAVHEAHASQVGTFGSITRAIQVDETPTILIVNKHGQTTTLTGLTDVFSVEQAIAEARR
jgi:hypothetical protein